MKERDAARLFDDILSGRSELDASVPEEVRSALELAGRLHTSNPSDANRKGMAELNRLMAHHPAHAHRTNRRPDWRLALQGLTAFFVLAVLGLLFSRLLTVILRPSSSAPMVAMLATPQSTTQPAPAGQPIQPPLALTEAPSQPAATQPAPVVQQPTSEPLVVSMDQAVEQLPFPVLAPQDSSTTLQLQSVQIPAQQDQSNTVIQTYDSPQGEVTITQSELNNPTAPAPASQPTPTETTTGTVNVRGQTGRLSQTAAGQNALTWQEGSTDITISGNLPETQLVTLAETLKPADQPSQPVTIDCDTVFPGLPGCQSQDALASGRLVFVDPRPTFNNRPYVADLQTGAGWPAGSAPGQPVSFSPSGRYLLVHSSKGSFQIYDPSGQRVLKIANGLPFDPFWLPQAALQPNGDWLAASTPNGGLQVYHLPSTKAVLLLPAGAFPAGRATQPVASHDGWVAWIQNSGAGPQTIQVAPLNQPGLAHGLPLISEDQKNEHYSLLDWAPGTHTLLLGGALQESGGIALYSFNVDTGKLTRLPAAMLNTPAAYDWNPIKPGLMALAEGGGASIAANKRLALLNVETGIILYPILTEQSQPADNFPVFQPKWSPDGRYLAYAGLQIAAGANTTSEDALLGRGIWVLDTGSSPMSNRLITAAQAGQDSRWIDSWPQWTRTGGQLLYTRQKDGKTDVRVRDLETGKDSLLLTGLPDPACVSGGCNWSKLLLYTPISALPPIPDTASGPEQPPTPTQPTPTPPATATPTPIAWAITAQLQPPEGSQESQQNWLATELVGRWLQTYVDSKEIHVAGPDRLEDYLVTSAVPLQAFTPPPNAPQVDFYAQVTFDVKPASDQQSIWQQAGTLQSSGWINGWQRAIGVVKEGDVYKMVLLP